MGSHAFETLENVLSMTSSSPILNPNADANIVESTSTEMSSLNKNTLNVVALIGASVSILAKEYLFQITHRIGKCLFLLIYLYILYIVEILYVCELTCI